MFCWALSITASRSARRVSVSCVFSRRLAHRLIEIVAEPVEPLGQPLHVAGDLALRPHQVGHVGGKRVACPLRRLRGPRLRPPPGDDGEGEKHQGYGEQNGEDQVGHRGEFIPILAEVQNRNG